MRVGIPGPLVAAVTGLGLLLMLSCSQQIATLPKVEPRALVTTISTTSAITGTTITATSAASELFQTGPVSAVIDRTWQSVVRVRGLGCKASQVGTGFVVKKGLVVTAAHVVAGLASPEVHLGSNIRTASIVAFNSVSDLAALAVDTAGAIPLSLADAAAGQVVVVLAFDEVGDPETISSRVVRPVRAVGDDIYGEPGEGRDALEIAASVKSGNSGAPVVDLDGDAVGLLFSRTRGGVEVAYAVQSSEVVSLLEAVNKGGGEVVTSGECRPR